MELIIIYIWTMLVTSAIGLKDRQRGSVYIPKYIKVILILPTCREEKVAIYLIIIHSLMQLVTILCIFCLRFGMQYKEIQKLYGLFMGGICVLTTIICSWLFRKGK